MTQETQTKKGPSIVVIALGLICIILAASTIAAFTLNTQDTTELDKKDKTIAELNEQVKKLTNEITALIQDQNTDQSTQISTLNARIKTLGDDLAAANQRIDDLKKIANLEMSVVLYNKTLTQDAGARTNVYHESLNYAGYLVIETKANSTSCFAEITYTFKNSEFTEIRQLGNANNAKVSVIVPVLPATIKIVIGNDNKEAANEDKPIYDNKAEDLLITLYY